MERDFFIDFDSSIFPSPSFVVDTDALKSNLDILDSVRKKTGSKILLAQKGFAMFSLYPFIREYLDGVCASGLNEARLGYEEFALEVHTYSPAFIENDFDSILEFSDHIVFNSFSQLEKYREKTLFAGKTIGLRINPEHRETEVEIYDPCRTGSRLGVTVENFKKDNLEGVTGLHFHTLCEKNSDSLERTLRAAEKRFGEYFKKMKWVNFGGGHHITRKDYDLELLVSLINRFKDKYGVDVYLEPGEAVALNTGVLVATVLDIVENCGKAAILDTSAATHMPDVLEMPYRPYITGSAEKGVKQFSYTLGGVSCLAGDIIGEYSFDSPLRPGDRLVFTDMAHYSMVKTTTFNGVNLPSIVKYSSSEKNFTVVKEFGYSDFKGRLS